MLFIIKLRIYSIDIKYTNTKWVPCIGENNYLERLQIPQNLFNSWNLDNIYWIIKYIMIFIY